MSAALLPGSMELTLEAGRPHGARARTDGDVLDLLDARDLRGAVQRLMERHGAQVYRFCRTALRDEALADDVHQVVFMEVLRDLPKFQRRASLLTWILSIAHHRVVDAARRRDRIRARAVELDLDDTQGDAVPALEQLDQARLRADVARAVASLDVATRTAVLLRYQQGLSFEEMATVCREKSATLQARVTRALPRLRALIAP